MVQILRIFYGHAENLNQQTLKLKMPLNISRPQMFLQPRVDFSLLPLALLLATQDAQQKIDLPCIISKANRGNLRSFR